MAIGTTAALITAGALSAGAGIGAAAIGSSAAGKAASTQAEAADRAAQLQYQASQDALRFQQQVFDWQRGAFQPWLSSGTGALANLNWLMGIPQQAFSTASFGAPAAAPTAPRLPPSGVEAGGWVGGNRELPRTVGNERFSRLATLDMAQGPDGVFSVSGEVPLSSLGSPVKTPTGIGTTTPGFMPPHTLPPPGAEAGGAGAPGTVPAGVNPALGGFGSLMAPWTDEFTAPTAETLQVDPGFQFRLTQGNEALERSAAARGGLLTGATARALTDYSQGAASQEYSNAYTRALTEYQQAYNVFQQNQSNQFNRLAAMSGMGQTAAGQLSGAGAQAAGNVGNILLGTAGNIGQAYQNAANARASGYATQGSLWGGALQGGTSNLSDLLLMSQLFGGQQQSGGGTWV